MNKEALEKSLKYLGSWLDFRAENSQTTGFVVLVADKDKVLFKRAYGYANLERQKRMTTNHLFRVASHSKMFTAVAILQLVEKEKLRLDDYAAQYLPWLTEHKDKRWQRVTIRQLLSHSAGVIRDGLESDYWQLAEEFPEAIRLKKDILAADLVVDSNVQMKYSNFGFAILGLIIEALSGQSYEDYIIDNIIRPLKLENTGPEYKPVIDSQLVTGYSHLDNHKTRKPIDNIRTGALAPATGLYSNASDLAIFLNALRLGSKKLLSDESKREMQRTHWQVHNTNFREEYGFGLEINYYDNHKLIGHDGGFPGQSTSSVFDTETEMTVIVLANCFGSDLGNIRDGVLGTLNYFQDSYKPGSSKHDLSKFEGRFINLWGPTDIIALGDKLISTFPSWRPFASPEELSVVDAKTLKVSKTNGYYSAGELVHYRFNKSGRIKSILFCGSTMWPEDDWLAKFLETAKVTIPKIAKS